MSRATRPERIQRLNMAISLLKRGSTGQKAVRALAGQFHLSARQAYRYVQRAQTVEGPLPVPEGKAVFTVKLPRTLIGQVRRRARRKGQPVSELVSQALRSFLGQAVDHGQGQAPA